MAGPAAFSLMKWSHPPDARAVDNLVLFALPQRQVRLYIDGRKIVPCNDALDGERLEGSGNSSQTIG